MPLQILKFNSFFKVMRIKKKNRTYFFLISETAPAYPNATLPTQQTSQIVPCWSNVGPQSATQPQH